MPTKLTFVLLSSQLDHDDFDAGFYELPGISRSHGSRANNEDICLVLWDTLVCHCPKSIIEYQIDVVEDE